MQNDFQCYRRAIASRLVKRAKDETVRKSTNLQLSVGTVIAKRERRGGGRRGTEGEGEGRRGEGGKDKRGGRKKERREREREGLT